MNKIERFEIEDLVITLKSAVREGYKVVFLIGAGVSRSAGIAMTSEMIPRLKEFIYDREKEKSGTSVNIESYINNLREIREISAKEGERQTLLFGALMKHLRPANRQIFIQQCLERNEDKPDREPHLNWAHIYLGQLISSGYVDTVLTTNFDFLLQDALRLYDINPLICYHEATADDILAPTPFKKIVHIHGNAATYRMRATPEEVEGLPENFRDVIKDVCRNACVIVIGYRGGEASLMNILLQKAEGGFPNFLYWVAHEKEEGDLTNFVKDTLAKSKGTAQLLLGQDADNFFHQLVKGLQLGLPPFISKPFSTQKRLIESLPEHLELPGVMAETKRMLEEAIRNYETNPVEDKVKAHHHFLKAVSLFEKVGYNDALKEVKEAIKLNPGESDYWFLQGLIHQKMNELKEACVSYEEAVRIKPDEHEAYCNWGSALSDLAQREPDLEKARHLFEASFQKYRKATSIKTDMHGAYYNWGSALSDLAQREPDLEKARHLFGASFQKYQEATRIKADFHEAYNNWGLALSALARREGDLNEARPLFEESFKKYQEATRIKADNHEVYFNWGTALLDLAQRESDLKKAKPLFEESFQKYQEATRIKTDSHEAYNNWGLALLDLARREPDLKKAKPRFEESFQKYQEATRIKADYHEAYNNWGLALADMARMEEDLNKARPLFEESLKKYQEAVKINPDFHDTYKNWAIILSNMAMKIGKDTPEGQEKLKEALQKFERALEIAKDPLCYYGISRAMAGLRRCEEAREMLSQLPKTFAALAQKDPLWKNCLNS